MNAGQGAAFVGATILCIGAAGAATAEETIFADEIRVESAAAQDLLGNAAITEEELAARNPASLRDIFRGETAVQGTPGAAIAQKVTVHGIEESLLSVTIDGARQNKSAFHHTGNVLLDPALLKRVDISSGLAPADAGPGAVAGAIAYETMDARDLLAPEETWGGLASFSASSNGPALRAGLTVFGQAEGFELLLSGTRAWGGDYSDGDGTETPSTAPDTTALIAKAAYTAPDGWRFEASADHTDDTSVRPLTPGPGGLLFARPDFAIVYDRTTGLPVNVVMGEASSERRSYTLTFTDDTPSGMWDPFVQATYNVQSMEAGDGVGENTSLSFTAQNGFRVLGGVLTAGVDMFHDTAEGSGPANTAPAKETLSNIGLFAQMRHDVTDSISLSWGGRADAQRFELADGTKVEDAGLSGNLAADILLTEGLSLNLGAATVWGGHELSEAALINFFGPWSYQAVEPMRSWNGRAGLRYEVGDFTVSGAAFYTRIDDAPYILGADRTNGDGSLDEVVTQGFDAALTWQGETAFATLNYTFSDVQVNDAPIGSTAYYYGRPGGHFFALEGAWDVTEQWRVGGVVTAALSNGDYDPALPGYLSGDIYAEYRPVQLPGATLRAEVRNIADATYASRTADGINATNVAALNEPGRSFIVSLTQRF